MKIVLCSSEVVPFAKTGGLADVCGALPLALENLKQEVIIVMPNYASVKDSGIAIKQLKPGFSFATIGSNINPIRNTEALKEENNISNGVKVYFIENDQYYNRPGLYGDKTGDYQDNLLRFSFYCAKTLELLKVIGFCPDIIHCNDWQTALIPVYLKTHLKDDDFYKKTKTILTIHNLAYQGLFPKEEFSYLKLDKSLFSIDEFEFYGKISLLKAGIIFTDSISTVSGGYAQEMLTKEFGCGLEEILEKRKNDLSGIINGLDYSIWNPKTDKHIFKNFDGSVLGGKKKNKKELQKICGLMTKGNIPLLGFVGRLAEQKGIDLLSEVIKNISNLNIQIVILGTGDQKYHILLEDIAKQVPQFFSLNLKFDNTLAHRIYAGCDMFLMPSRYEPCGLGQIICFKYGTIPIVYKTGGLSDTVFDFDSKTKDGNGFVFTSYANAAFLDVINHAKSIYADKKTWNSLIKRVMTYNFSWEESAKKYIELYKRI
ncbi:MAG: glycogen synthase GlgA [Candidatus Omnitrophica bacterium]|nr:glycogen synthase GlgA [Candidatus Omnitrophota bacterium]